MNSLRIFLIWVLTASVLVGQTVLPNRRKVFQSAAGTTLNDNLIAYWKMDETGDATVDRVDSFGSNDLNANGGTIVDEAGKIGNAVAVEDVTAADNLTLADNADVSFGNESFTWVAWVRIESKAANQRIIDKWDSAANKREYLIRFHSTTDRFEAFVSNDGTASVSVTANTFGAPTAGVFYMLAFGYDADADVLWVSVNAGTKDTTAHTTGCNDNTTTLSIGGVIGGWFDGRIDEMGLWGKSLSAAELTELYNATSGLTCCPFP